MVVKERPNKSYIMELSPYDLYVDQRFQRVLDENFIKKQVKAGWDPEMAGYLLVNETPEGLFSVLDGQHRAELARRCKIQDKLICEVYYNLPEEECARIYQARNWNKVPMRSLDRFVVRVFRQDPDAVMIDDMLTRHGLHIERNRKATSNGGLTSVAVLERLVRIKKVGPAAVDRGLGMITSIWGAHYKEALRAKFIAGVILFCAAYPDVSLKEVQQKLSEHNPVKIYQHAGQFRTRPGVFNDAYTISMAMVDMYNYGRRADYRLDPLMIPTF